MRSKSSGMPLLVSVVSSRRRQKRRVKTPALALVRVIGRALVPVFILAPVLVPMPKPITSPSPAPR